MKKGDLRLLDLCCRGSIIEYTGIVIRGDGGDEFRGCEDIARTASRNMFLLPIKVGEKF